MANSFLCNSCAEEFPSLFELQAHIKEVHTQQRRSEFKIPPSVISDAETTASGTETPPPPIVPEPPPVRHAEPIKLTYQFKGTCSVCFNVVKTIETMVGEALILIAWCNSCDRQLSSLEVIPIDEQVPKHEQVKIHGKQK